MAFGRMIIFTEDRGLNRFRPPILLDPAEMVRAKNIMYWRGRRSRGGATKINTAAMDDGRGPDAVRALWAFDVGSSVKTIAYGGTKIYDFDLITGSFTDITGTVTLADDALAEAAVLYDTTDNKEYLVVTDGINPLVRWNGTGTFATIVDTTAQGVKYLTNNDNRLFGIGKSSDPNRLFFTAPFKPADWTTTNEAGSILVYPKDGGRVTGLATYMGNIFVFKERGIYLVDTSPASISSWRAYKIGGGIGCLSHRTIKIAGTEIIFASYRGVVGMDTSTNNIRVLTDPLLHEWQNLSKADAAYWNAVLDKTKGWYILNYMPTAQLVFNLTTGNIVGEWTSQFPGNENVTSLLDTVDANQNEITLAGGSKGYIYQINNLTALNDDTLAINSEWRTPHIPLLVSGGMVYEFVLLEGGIYYTPISSASSQLDIDVIVDGNVVTTRSIWLEPLGDLLNVDFILNESMLGGGELGYQKFSLTGQGQYVQLAFRSSGNNQGFNLYALHLLYDQAGKV